MRLRSLLYPMLMCSLAVAASQSNSRTAPAASASDIPHLQKQGTATQLIVDGKPFLARCGELLNNSATSLEYMKPVWAKLVETNLNIVIAGVSWAQIEPAEGKFDFKVVDGVIEGARSHNLRLVLIWFASWKNGLSSYPPDWLKKDFARYPRVQIEKGRTIELLSTLSDANRDADAHAFAALMRHVKEVDGRNHTVVMIQVENEVGVLGDSRDRSPAANKAFEGPVPKELMDYLQKNKETLIPEFRKVWEAAGSKTSGTWEEVFGQGPGTDEIFMAWNYARYVGRVAAAGKAEYPIPMYANAWLYGGGRPNSPGRTPSGGPLPHVMDLWRAGAPSIDIVSPDLYNDVRVFRPAVYPEREPALHTRDAGWGGRRRQGALRLRTLRRHRHFAVRHRQCGGQRSRTHRRLRSRGATGAPDSGAPGQRHDVRRPDGPQRPAAEGPGGESHRGGHLPGAPRGARSNGAAAGFALGGRHFHCGRA